MSEIYKTEVGELYFSSCSVVGWLDVFVRREYQDILVDSFKFCQKEKELEIFAYCIMPSHFHLIARGKEKKLNEILRDFKSFTAKKVIEAFENNPMESRKERLMKAFEWYGKTQSAKTKISILEA